MKDILTKIVKKIQENTPEGVVLSDDQLAGAFMKIMKDNGLNEGKSNDEMREMFNEVRAMIRDDSTEAPEAEESAGPAAPFEAAAPDPSDQIILPASAAAEPPKPARSGPRMKSYQYKGIPGIDVSEITEETTIRYAEILDDQSIANGTEEQKDRALFEAFSEVAPSKIPEGLSGATKEEWTALFQIVKSWIEGYGVLTPLIEDSTITEIMCNGPRDIWIENDDGLVKTDLFFSDQDSMRRILTKIASTVARRIDESSPILDCRLQDGSRVNATLSPPTINGPSLTIRKFPEDSITIDKLISFNSLTPRAAKFLEHCVDAALNILVIGGTGAGKTTMLNALGNFIPSSARIVTIEDAAELQLQHEHVLKHEARPANLEGSGEITIGDLLKSALRQRPDRIIVGECRSGEAFDMLQAMNTGHDGSMSTLHANTPKDGLARLNNLVLQAGNDLSEQAINGLISSALDLIVYCGKVPIPNSGGKMRRMVTHITEVMNVEGATILTQPIYEAKPINGTYYLSPSGLRPGFEKTKFFNNGIRCADELFMQDETDEKLLSDIAAEQAVAEGQRWID